MTFEAAQQRQPFRPDLFRSFFQGDSNARRTASATGEGST